MSNVTIDRVKARCIATRKLIDMPVQRVRLDGVLVGYIHDRSPITGTVAFIVSNLSDDERDDVLSGVSDILGILAEGYSTAPIEKDNTEETVSDDFGDF